MKKNILFLCALVAISTSLKADTRDFPPILLTDPKLKFVDGKSYAMDGRQYKKTMKFRLNVNQRRHGEKTPNGLVGLYTFEDNKWSLDQLIELEHQLQTSNSSADHARLKTMHETLLTTIMEEFLALSQPFLEDARGAKKDMMALISEWATKADRKSSYLLDWGASKEGEEANVIRTKIKCFEDFDCFLTDLVYFLETLMRSCPVATAQFKEILKKEQAALAQK